MESIKTRKQGNSLTLTVPSSFNIPAGVRVQPELTSEGIFYKFIKDDDFFDFDVDILQDLISQGYQGQKLITEFAKRKKHIPNALKKLRVDAIKEAKTDSTMTKDEAKKYFGI